MRRFVYGVNLDSEDYREEGAWGSYNAPVFKPRIPGLPHRGGVGRQHGILWWRA